MCPESILPSKMEGSLQACTYLGWSGKKQHPEVCQESTGKAVKEDWTSQVTLDAKTEAQLGKFSFAVFG